MALPIKFPKNLFQAFEHYDKYILQERIDILEWCYNQKWKNLFCWDEILGMAIIYSKIEVVRWLLDHDYKKYITHQDMDTIIGDENASPIRFEIINLLLEAGGKFTMTGLENAACNGNFEMIKLLYPSWCQEIIPSVMDGAINSDQYEIVKYLHNNGARFSVFGFEAAQKTRHRELEIFLAQIMSSILEVDINEMYIMLYMEKYK